MNTEEEINLEEAVAIFLNNKERGISIEFYKEDYLVGQVMKGYDVLKWEWLSALRNVNEKSIIFLFHFHEDKSDNTNNKSRFEKSNFFQDFQKVSFKEEMFFITVIKPPWLNKVNKLSNKFKEMIYSVYEFDGLTKLKFSVGIG